jgi:hypothetical protein
MSIENIHLWHADRGTYFDRNVNIISWSDQYNIRIGKYNSIGRDCNFFLHANHRPDWITTSSQLWGPVTHEIAKCIWIWVTHLVRVILLLRMMYGLEQPQQ